MTSLMAEPGRPHVLIFPYPAQGHMIPLLDLTHLLATRNLTITILVTPKNLHYLRPILSLHPTITPLVLQFPSHPSIPDGVENTVDLPAGGFVLMMTALAGLHGPIRDWFRSHPSPPVAIISDMFLGWTHHLAMELQIRRYTFSPSGASAISIVNQLWKRLPVRKDCENPNERVSFPNIPKSPSYPWWQLSNVFRSYVRGNPDSESIKEIFLGNIASHGHIFNTFSELESEYLDFLRKDLGHERVWSVGPALPAEEGERGGSSSVLPSEVAAWLDGCEERSVVYVCFGSQAVLTNKQMEELALGLEKSGVKFVLSYKGATKGHVEGKGNYGVIPEGFEDRVAGQGLVIKGWAPQVMILRHKSVCAFLTHCGWNSTLESIVAGMPMLTWPMGADQFPNATLLEELGVAVRVCEGAETVLPSDDLVRFLTETMGEEWRGRRARAEGLSKAAVGAIGEGGSSFKNLDGFVEHLSSDAVKITT